MAVRQVTVTLSVRGDFDALEDDEEVLSELDGNIEGIDTWVGDESFEVSVLALAWTQVTA